MIGQNILKEDLPIVVNICDADSTIYNYVDNAIYSNMYNTNCDNNINNEYKNLDYINVSSSSAIVYKVPTTSITLCFKSESIMVKSDGCALIPSSSVPRYYDVKSISNIVKSHTREFTYLFDDITCYVKELYPIYSPSHIGYIYPSCSANINTINSKNRNYDSLCMNVISTIKSNDVFHNNRLLGDVSDIHVGSDDTFFDSVSLFVKNKELESGNLKPRCESIYVKGVYMKPDQDSDYIPDPKPNFGGINLTSLNFKCQKGSYFEIGLVLGEYIRKASNLPDGVTFDGEKVKGVLDKAGDFTSIIELESGKIEFIFKVDSITRIL